MHGYLVPSGQIFAASAATFFVIVGSIFMLAAIFVLIVPMFGGARDYLAALKVATFGSIPVLLAGATLLLPIMALIGLIGLCHTAYLSDAGGAARAERAGGRGGRVRRHFRRAAVVRDGDRRRGGRRPRPHLTIQP